VGKLCWPLVVTIQAGHKSVSA